MSAVMLLAILGSTVAVTALAIKPKWGILAIFLVRPLVDACWETPILLGLKLTEIVSVLVPMVVLVHMALASGRERSLRAMPLRWIWLLWTADIAFFCGVIMYSQEPLEGAKVLFRHLNGFVGFYMIQAYFAKDRDLKPLLLALIFAGLFPIATGAFEGLTGHHWKITIADMGVVRNIGFYHDAITIRYYALQTLMGLLLFSTLYLKRRTIAKALMACYGVAATFVVYGAYSKSGTATLACWTLLWPLLRRQYRTVMGLGAAAMLLATYYSQEIFDRFGFIFNRELGAARGTLSTGYNFNGRLLIWDELMAQWSQSGLLHQVFGSGQVALGAHNDYLQILYHGGILGLTIYMSLLLTAGLYILRNLSVSRSPLNVAALLALVMWMVDTIGLVPSAMPGYQWFVWGLIGLAMRRHGNAMRESKAHARKGTAAPGSALQYNTLGQAC